jgi:NADH dehydrogenase FAD-containing subunit
MTRRSASYDVVVLGAGYAGLMAALRLGGRKVSLTTCLIGDRESFVERVRLQEQLVADLPSPLPPLAQWLAGTNVIFVAGRVASLEPEIGSVAVETDQGPVRIAFGRCIYALGSRTSVGAVPGAAAHAFRLDAGGGLRSAASLRERLRIAPDGCRAIIVGGGNTAVEAAAEIRAARPDFMVTMVAAGRAGDFGKGRRVERLVRARLESQNILLIDDDPIAEVGPDGPVSESGRLFPADFCVWAGGLRSPGIARDAGLAVDGTNRIWVDAALRSISHPRVLAIGDAARPVAPTGAAYRLSAFAALTSGAYASASLLTELRGKRPRPFSFSSYGQGVAIGKEGIGFLSYPDDGDGYFVLTGRLALWIRNLFVRALVWFLRIERRWPGLGLFWIGRRRVSWQEAESALAACLPHLVPPEQPQRPGGAGGRATAGASR